ncbi:MAG: hypothetical protein QE271_09915 [Bacteriovoracaceae bacterium]|nr:hypothetical protein [Bacteriovoracaceae bacterium]
MKNPVVSITFFVILFLISLIAVYLTTYIQVTVMAYGLFGGFIAAAVVGWLLLGGLSWIISKEFKGIFLLKYVLISMTATTLFTVLFTPILHLDHLTYFTPIFNVLISFIGLFFLFQILTPDVSRSKLLARISLFIFTWQTVVFTISYFSSKIHMKYTVEAPGYFASLKIKTPQEFEQDLQETFKAAAVENSKN